MSHTLSAPSPLISESKFLALNSTTPPPDDDDRAVPVPTGRGGDTAEDPSAARPSDADADADADAREVVPVMIVRRHNNIRAVVVGRSRVRRGGGDDDDDAAEDRRRIIFGWR